VDKFHLRHPVGDFLRGPPNTPPIDAPSQSLCRARTVMGSLGSYMGTTSRLQVPLRPSQAPLRRCLAEAGAASLSEERSDDSGRGGIGRRTGFRFQRGCAP
jgi:hypothetical protein